MTPVITSLSPVQGRAEQAMTITGTGLSGATKVNFGGKSVAPTTVTDTSVDLTIPPGCSGQSNVTVTAEGTQSNFLAFFYIAAPWCTSLAPNTGPGTSTAAIDIFGQGLATADLVTFGAVGSVAPASIVSDTHITAVPPTHGAFAGCTDTVAVSISSPGGTSAIGTACQFTYQDHPTVNGVTPNTGAAGTTGVQVNGGCFLNVSTVTFDPVTTPGTPVTAPFAGLGVDALTVDVPATLAAGTYDIQVTTPGGTSAKVPADQFTVI
jgi:hypothetical protein